MSYRSNWDSGSWNVICDECGRKYKAGQLRLRWDGLMVCEKDWEPRQPQDYVRGVADIQAPKWARPEVSDTFVPINYTSSNPEPIPVTEVFITSTGYHRTISSAEAPVLNGAVINNNALNGSGSGLEAIPISENVSTGISRPVSDSMTITETTSFKLNSFFLTSLLSATLLGLLIPSPLTSL